MTHENSPQAYHVQETGVGFYPELGYRLAGICDGEGHFGIIRAGRKRTGFACIFVINMRDDDRPLLERLCEETGLGAMYSAKAVSRPAFDSRPMAIWRVQNKHDALALATILEVYPLWSKKQRDFEIWAKAVRYLNSSRPRGWAPMERWFHEIKAVRKYGALTTPEIDAEEEWTLFDLGAVAG